MLKLSSQIFQTPQRVHKLLCGGEGGTCKENFVTERGTDVQYRAIFEFVFRHRFSSGVSWGRILLKALSFREGGKSCCK